MRAHGLVGARRFSGRGARRRRPAARAIVMQHAATHVLQHSTTCCSTA
jgi:hypothetical protein